MYLDEVSNCCLQIVYAGMPDFRLPRRREIRASRQDAQSEATFIRAGTHQFHQTLDLTDEGRDPSTRTALGKTLPGLIPNADQRMFTDPFGNVVPTLAESFAAIGSARLGNAENIERAIMAISERKKADASTYTKVRITTRDWLQALFAAHPKDLLTSEYQTQYPDRRARTYIEPFFLRGMGALGTRIDNISVHVDGAFKSLPATSASLSIRYPANNRRKPGTRNGALITTDARYRQEPMLETILCR